MRVQDLQQFLSKFTEGKKDGSRQGNALSNAVIYVEINGYIHKIVRMEVQEHAGKGPWSFTQENFFSFLVSWFKNL
jgi:hypothetical protein